MPKVLFEPMRVYGKFEENITLLEAADELDIGIRSPCKGRGVCGKCKVRIKGGLENLNDLTDREEKMLSKWELSRDYRLACVTEVKMGEVIVEVPKESRVADQIILSEGKRISYEKNPVVKVYDLKIPLPTLENPMGDFERIKQAFSQDYEIELEEIDYEVQKTLPAILREDSRKNNQKVSLSVWNDREIINLEREESSGNYGIALDLGTTTIVGYLMDLMTGEVVCHDSMVNPQVKFGEDLITRVTYAMEKEEGLQKMQKEVIESINNEIIDDVCREAGVHPEEINEMVCVGNTGMHHFFLGIVPEYLARSPYAPARHSSIDLKSRDLGVNINPAGYVHWLPVNGGWVGPDNVAVLLATQVYDRPEMSIVLDIGTNAEVFVGNSEEAYVGSTAAGGAFEGAQINFGMRASPGSIEKVKIDPSNFEPKYKTIGGKSPKGICGSGIIDTVAELYKVGIVNKSGLFEENLKEKTPRLRKGKKGIWEYVLSWKQESSINSDITINQKDIREIQKSKGAVQAGARVLMEKLGIKEVDRVILAGAFGNYINEASARSIGLFPECPLDKVERVGNAAGIGAQIALMSEKKRKETKEIVKKVDFVELAGIRTFRDQFIKAMQFPNMDESLYPRVMDEIRAIRDGKDR